MKPKLCWGLPQVLFCIFVATAGYLEADTIAYWRFEGEGATVPFDGAFVQDTNSRTAIQLDGIPVPDLSGNGNRLVGWENNGSSGHVHRPTSTTTPFSAVPQTGEPNGFYIENSGDVPASFTWSSQTSPSGVNLDTWTSLTWTIEASFYTDVLDGYRTVVGRDGVNLKTGEAGHAALYFQKMDNNRFRISYVDASGANHVAEDPIAMVIGQWYHFAATCDGVTLKLHKKTGNTGAYETVASTTVSASSNPALIAPGTDGTGSPWGWSVGRGRYGTSTNPNDNHADRWDGGIDEVRISNMALDPSLFLASFSAADTDGDGLPNSWESANLLDPNDNGLNPNNVGVPGNPDNGASGDPDGDSFNNLAEYQAASDPRNPSSDPNDIDGDGLPDSWETTNFGNLNQNGSGDFDLDTVSNLEEFVADPQTNPTDRFSFPESETNPDGVPDGWEQTYFESAETQDGSGDPDLDTLDNFGEYAANSIPNDPLSTGSPTGDIDNDLLDDRWEVANFGNQSAQNGDGQADADGFSNLAEYQAGSNPNSAASTPNDVNADGLADVVSFIDFTTLGTSGITDRDAEFTGLVRLANTGTNGAYLPNDPNINIDTTGTGTFTFRTETTDFNGQVGMPNMAALGINLSTLGFNGSQDFIARVKFINTPAMAAADQLGIFAGASSTQLVRGGRIAESGTLGVNTNGNNDSAAVFPANSPSLVAGQPMTVEISRTAGVWALSVHGINITPSEQPAFLNSSTDLTVGFYGSDLFTGGNHKFPAVESLTVVRMGGGANPDLDNDGMDDAWEAANFSGDGNGLPDEDDDNDGVKNLAEFAFNGDPESGSSLGGITHQLADSDADTQRELLLTIPVRNGATFSVQGDGSQKATVGSMSYVVRGTVDLANFNGAVEKVGTPVASGSPDYQLHTFRLMSSEGLVGKGFLQAYAVTP